jgi:mRNA interferase MazF
VVAPAQPLRRFDVLLVALDPTIGAEIQKTRPCVVISPDELNSRLSTLIVAPMTSRGRPYPWRVPLTFQGKSGWIVLDQIRTVDLGRVVRRLGQVEAAAARETLEVLAELFAP